MKLRALAIHGLLADEHARFRTASSLRQFLRQTRAQMEPMLFDAALRNPPVAPVFQTIAKTLGEAFDNMEKQTRRLDLSLLHTEGLDAALTALCLETEQTSTVSVRYTCAPGCPTLKNDDAILLFRSVQEAVHNAGRHAGAANIHIARDCRGSHVVITVTDNGKGFDTTLLEAFPYERSGLGLFSIREWITGAGGTVEVVSHENAGTCVMIRLPTAVTTTR
ncbi:MAG: hypothetical protein FJY97_01785 [candidate division Zixibacteria bacterium]|nr:hypothetical protein [candidate division Zixibacteria bacterium]